MASVWIEKRSTTSGGTRYRVKYRTGGRESIPRYAGSFSTKRQALARKAWVAGEIASMRLPDLAALAEPPRAEMLREIAERWRASRKDVREATVLQHRTSLNHVNRLLGDRPYDAIMWEHVQRDLIDVLAAEGRARESVRKCRTVLSMVLDFGGVTPNPARDPRVKLPLAEPDEVEPPSADHVEAVGWLLAPSNLVGLVALDATGARVGELAAATIGDLDENRQAWLVRAKVAKTRCARWVELPHDLFRIVVDHLPAREDRNPEAPLFPIGSTDRLRMAITRACRYAGRPVFSPHDLRHRRISLLHHQGVSWAEIGARVGQRNLSTTADTYTHVLMDYREIDRRRCSDVYARCAPPRTPARPKTPHLQDSSRSGAPILLLGAPRTAGGARRGRRAPIVRGCPRVQLGAPRSDLSCGTDQDECRVQLDRVDCRTTAPSDASGTGKACFSRRIE